jgi:nicotinate-nucleotide adenylyltransferase
VFGGTFNPVHYGHLRSALELVEHLDLAECRLMPSAQPPHREAPACSAKHRAAMVELAVRGESRLVCDRRELEREGPSYTVDSLAEMRSELGPAQSLVLVVGCDALLGLPTWHRWQSLLELAHVVVLARPGWDLPADGEMATWLSEHRLPDAAALRDGPAGGVHIESLRPLAISATEIRRLLESGKSARYLLPEQVLDYIEEHDLYRQEHTH